MGAGSAHRASARRLRTERPAADRLFSGVRLLPIGRSEAELVGTWRRQFASTGVTLHQADCLIAATAVRAGATLATGNVKDFPMDGRALQDRPPGGELTIWSVVRSRRNQSRCQPGGRPGATTRSPTAAAALA